MKNLLQFKGHRDSLSADTYKLILKKEKTLCAKKEKKIVLQILVRTIIVFKIARLPCQQRTS